MCVRRKHWASESGKKGDRFDVEAKIGMGPEAEHEMLLSRAQTLYEQLFPKQDQRQPQHPRKPATPQNAPLGSAKGSGKRVSCMHRMSSTYKYDLCHLPKVGDEPAVVASDNHSAKKFKGESKGRDMSKVKCFKCKGFGHFIADCPQK